MFRCCDPIRGSAAYSLTCRFVQPGPERNVAQRSEDGRGGGDESMLSLQSAQDFKNKRFKPNTNLVLWHPGTLRGWAKGAAELITLLLIHL